MIQKILDEGKYNFIGSVEDLKKHLRGFKIKEILCQGDFDDIKIFNAIAEFKYHGVIYKLKVEKLWNKDVIIIKNITKHGGY